MAFRLQQAEGVAEGIKRIASEQLSLAIEHLETETGLRDEHVHEARKAMKRLRAVVRLVRVELGDEIYRLENSCYRDAAGQLSGVRDAAALLEALDALTEFAGTRLRRNRFATVGKWLAERRDAIHAGSADDGDVARRVVNDLRWARRRVHEWPLDDSGWKTLQTGICRVYSRGRRRYQQVLVQPGDELFHEWRKWVKYLWYHVQMAREVWPGMMVTIADELDELGDLLGQDHDLTVLRDTVMAEMSRPIRATTLQALLELVEDRQTHLRERACRIGRRVYVERPQDFGRRFQGYWRAWRSEAPAPAPTRKPPHRPAPVDPELIADYSCQVGEGPLWHPLEKRLYWLDIPNGKLFRYEPSSGTHEQCHQCQDQIGGFTIQADSALLLFMARGAVAIWREGALESVIDELAQEADSRFNDVIADPAGRVFCGTMPGAQRPARLYRLDPDGSMVTVLDDVGLANGMGFSPDRSCFYFTDSARGLIQVLDYDEASGVVSNPRVLVDMAQEPGMPDGMTVDAEGCIWSARWDGGCLVRYAPDGEELRRIQFPARKVSSVTFGGEGQKDMYVTTAGGQDKAGEGPGAGCLFRLQVGCHGLPEFLSRIGP
jgi:D-xylono/L-arabinono-1,4-lactonase